MGYNNTINLPKTDFPMRAKLPKREPEVLSFWEENDIYKRVQEKNKGKPKFVLHDGPPYANGDIHLGHTLNKILKDIIVRYHSMRGCDAPYVPGWDTHGLPIEQQAIKKLGIDRQKVSTVEFRRRCKDYALKYVEVQKEQFKRLGVRGDWENPYLTLDPQFEAAQIGVFGEMAKKGYIYKGLKPVYWCAHCQTALAEAEVEYEDQRSPSIYVKFPVKESRGMLPEDSHVVIWTTTPWTLPANLAIAVHPKFEYVLFRYAGTAYLMAKDLYQEALEDMGLEADVEIIDEFTGEQLDGIVTTNPLVGRDSVVILGEHVTLEQGTGCVHTAPGHGLEDYEIGRQYGLSIFSPLDNRGVFTSEIEKLEGLTYDEANKRITEILGKNGTLMNLDFITHQYPHCWRCKKPVIFRATEQWFASIDGFRQDLLKEIERVVWIPSWGKERMYKMVADRQDWCISRQRTWGVPIPVFYCGDCGSVIITNDTISHVQSLIKENGSDIWFAEEAEHLVPEGLKCSECGSSRFEKEEDIMDVWFDSGSSHVGVLSKRKDLSWPADLYLEGSDQYRGWFNSSLTTAVAARGCAPYKMVLTHGFLVDEEGRKMSKSAGNVTDPIKVIENMGADILRLWVSSADYKRDVAASENIMKQMSEAYRKIRNTSRFLLGNLFDFSPEEDQVSYDDLVEIDKWALMKLEQLTTKVTEAYEKYEFHKVYHDIHNFCVNEMSSFYLNILKDRLYVSKCDGIERRSAQTVMYSILTTLTKLLAPILTFTTEEIWKFVPSDGNSPISVQLTDWPEANEEYIDQDLEEKWKKLIDIRDKVVDALEIARNEKTIGDSLEAQVELYSDKDTYEFLRKNENELAGLFIVSQVNIYTPEEEPREGTTFSADDGRLRVNVIRASGRKCERCWMYSEEVGSDEEYPDLCERCADVLRDA